MKIFDKKIGIILFLNIFFLYFPTAGHGNTFGVMIPKFCCVKPQKIKSPSFSHCGFMILTGVKRSHRTKSEYFPSWDTGIQFLSQNFSGNCCGLKLLPSFVLLIHFFNDTTLEPRELPFGRWDGMG